MEGVLSGVGFRVEVESDVVEVNNLLTLTSLLLIQPALHSLPVASLG